MKKRYLNILLLFVILCVMLLSGSLMAPVFAQTATETEETDEDFGEEMSGFEDDSDSDDGFADDTGIDVEAVKRDAVSAESDEWLQFGGFMKEEVGYSFEHESEEIEFSKIRSTLNLSADIKFTENWRGKAVLNGFYDYAYSNHGRDKFTDETLEAYESEAEVRDLFLDGAFWSWMRLKFGRQVIAWGESDFDQITDLANPRDNRELGMVDLEDARIPLLATKISVIAGTWEVNLVAIHENRPNKTPVEGSEFDPLSGLRGIFNIHDEELPEGGVDDTEYLFRLFKSLNGGDISLVWADVYEDGYYLDFESFNALEPVKKLAVTPRYKRVQAIGMAGNLVRGSWLFKGELARKTGVAVARSQENLMEQMTTLAVIAGITSITYYNKATGAVETWSEKDLMQGMLGFEYSGLDDFTIGLEGSLEKIEEYEQNLGSDEISGSTTAHVGYTAMNDTFSADFYWFHLTGDNGDVYRINLGYDMWDALNLSGGLIFYEASDEEALVYPFRNNDRIFTAVKFSF